MIESKKLRIVFMGTPDFAKEHLKTLFENNYNLVGVYCQPDRHKGRGKKLLPPPVKVYAEEKKLKVYQPNNINKKEAFEELKNIKPDIIITVAYGKILKSNVLDLPKFGCWNVHASLLPKYRGAAPIQRAIENGEKETGVSIFKIVEELDSGPVALIEPIKILEKDNYKDVHDKLIIKGCEMLLQLFNNIMNIKLKEQNHEKATYAKKIEKDDLIISLKNKSKDILNKIRAYDPYPGVKANINNTFIKLFNAENYNEDYKNENVSGQIIGKNKKGIIIKTLDHCIIIKNIQFPGKKICSTLDALNSKKINIKDVFK